jgi:methylmalonyl-CoA mutase C-terminal domain/subunit
MDLLRGKGMNDVTVLIGGIIPEADIPALKKGGIAEVFLPGTPTQAIVDFIRQRILATPQGA